ncbi:RidA family protein [Streptomyces sp. V1I1]|uniref:RidA family protein n=1 Tax=Streptomyces sp. V1I1 TaxID=3042272 RepID=UPI00277E0A6D|nr:Rid family hydrolase [Streptomyces sp. V1I1]MDQ0940121.1 enamine deaminase RidA (YjgF/YER057c/UK114 family) [Streptomyces sp. V1I1]
MNCPSDRISQIVSVEDTRLVHLSGQVAWDGDGRPVGPDDHGAQAAQIVRNLDTVLAAELPQVLQWNPL